MSDDLKKLAIRWFEEVWNQAREATIDELLSPDCVGYGLGEKDGQILGPPDFKIFWGNMRSALPDVRIHVEDVISEGDKAVVRLMLTGTHLGHHLGFPASNRRARVSGVVILRFSGGKIVEAWNSWDQLGLLQQLGAIPSPGTQDRFLTARN